MSDIVKNYLKFYDVHWNYIALNCKILYKYIHRAFNKESEGKGGGGMVRFYLICLIVGILVPLIGIVFDLFDGFFDFVSFDLLELEFADFDIDFLPLSANAVSMGLILFGGVGLLLARRLPVYQVNLAGGFSGYGGAVLLQSGIRFLRKRQGLAQSRDAMLGRNGRVVNAIPKGGYGSVILESRGSSGVSYQARSEDGEPIAQDVQVELVEIKGTCAVVRLRRVGF